MEEILASIRRIIADEQESAQSGRATASAAPAVKAERVASEQSVAPAVAPVAADVPPVEVEFESWLQETAGAQIAEPAAAFAPPPVEPQAFTAVPEPEPVAAQVFQPAPHLSVVPPSAAVAPSAPVTEPVHSPAAYPDALDAPLQPQLAQAPAEPQAAPPPQQPLLSGPAGASVHSSFQALARTMFMQNSALVDEAVRDMLQPMLKQWLDDNLPVIVERLVRAEIERVARGGR